MKVSPRQGVGPDESPMEDSKSEAPAGVKPVWVPEATDTPNAFFDDDLLEEDISLLFTASKAAVTGEPVSMALINRQFSATEAGKALGVVSPLLQAALDRDPAFAGVKLSPLPSFKTQ